MTTIESIENILDSYGEAVVRQLVSNLKTTNRASGNLRESIRFKIFTFGTVTTFELYLDDYYKFVDEGRKPTIGGGSWKGWSQPSLRKSILKWLSYKNIQGKVNNGKKIKMSNIQAQRTAAFLIARKIHRYGYKGSGFFTKVFESGGVGDSKLLEQQISEALGISVRVEIEEVRNEIGE